MSDTKQLTVLVPSIHPDKLPMLYKSVEDAFSSTFEFIVIGPYEPPEELMDKGNVRFIKDWGSPIRCQQRGLTVASGNWITWAADDGVYLPRTIDNSFSLLLKNDMFVDGIGRTSIPATHLVMGKYIEGELGNKHMAGDDYYVLSRHRASFSHYLPPHFLMLNVGIVSRFILLQIGGWDCRFEACPMAYNDLAIRLQNQDNKFIIQDGFMFECSHSPMRSGDHGPIHDAQMENDIPLFQRLYDNKDCVNRVKINLENWRDAPDRWERRFKNEGV